MYNKLKSTFVFALGVSMALAGYIAHAQQQPPQTLIPVSVELGDVSLTKLPIIMAADNGLFERNGLKVDMFITPRAAAAVRSAGVIVPPENIRAGGPPADIQISGGAFNVVNMTTIATAPPRIIIATMDNMVRFHIIARKGITSVDQIKGKRLGYTVPGALEQYSLLLYLHQRGWDPAHDVSMYMDGGDVGAIQKGQVDVIAGSEISIAAAKKLGLNDLIDLSQFNWPMPGSGVMALSNWLPNNHDAAMRFMKATVEAIALMKNNRQAAYASLTKWFGITDPTKLAAVYDSAQSLADKPYPSIAGLTLMRTVFNWRALNITKPTDFTDSSYVTALDKSGFIDSLYKKQAQN